MPRALSSGCAKPDQSGKRVAREPYLHADIAECGEHALEILRKGAGQDKPYHVVLGAGRLPDMDGPPLAGRIKSDPTLARLAHEVGVYRVHPKVYQLAVNRLRMPRESVVVPLIKRPGCLGGIRHGPRLIGLGALTGELARYLRTP